MYARSKLCTLACPEYNSDDDNDEEWSQMLCASADDLQY
jgi:hypothetical protein